MAVDDVNAVEMLDVDRILDDDDEAQANDDTSVD
jgi:hypothetical protein